MEYKVFFDFVFFFSGFTTFWDIWRLFRGKVKVTQSCPTLCDSMDCSPWDSPGQNTGVGSLSLLQGIFPTRDRTQVSHITGRFFTSWATGKVILYLDPMCDHVRELNMTFKEYLALCPPSTAMRGNSRMRLIFSESVSHSVMSFSFLSPSGSSVHGIFQARILEWVAIPFSRRSSWPRDRTRVFSIEGRFFTIWATREPWPLLNDKSKHWVAFRK